MSAKPHPSTGFTDSEWQSFDALDDVLGRHVGLEADFVNELAAAGWFIVPRVPTGAMVDAAGSEWGPALEALWQKLVDAGGVKG